VVTLIDETTLTSGSPTLSLPKVNQGLEHQLSRSFDSHGSDKGINGYSNVYASLLSDLIEAPHPVKILEVGLGTNNPKLVSTMGSKGRPGASLRAFKECVPNSKIFGVDVDRDVLFYEEGIQTDFVDQLDFASFSAMQVSLGISTLDLVVDDGLHSPEANLNTLNWALKVVRPGGYIVIEDIPDRSLGIWYLVYRILEGAGHKTLIAKCSPSNLFVVQIKR